MGRFPIPPPIKKHVKLCNLMKRYCLALDLKDDPALIAEYEAYHRSVWPEVIECIKASGVENLEIYRVANRLVMVMEVSDDFSFERKAAAEAANPKVREWETLMWKYQQALPVTKPAEKWVLMDKIFQLPPDGTSAVSPERRNGKP